MLSGVRFVRLASCGVTGLTEDDMLIEQWPRRMAAGHHGCLDHFCLDHFCH